MAKQGLQKRVRNTLLSLMTLIISEVFIDGAYATLPSNLPSERSLSLGSLPRGSDLIAWYDDSDGEQPSGIGESNGKSTNTSGQPAVQNTTINRERCPKLDIDMQQVFEPQQQCFDRAGFSTKDREENIEPTIQSLGISQVPLEPPQRRRGDQPFPPSLHNLRPDTDVEHSIRKDSVQEAASLYHGNAYYDPYMYLPPPPPHHHPYSHPFVPVAYRRHVDHRSFQHPYSSRVPPSADEELFNRGLYSRYAPGDSSPQGPILDAAANDVFNAAWGFGKVFIGPDLKQFSSSKKVVSSSALCSQQKTPNPIINLCSVQKISFSLVCVALASYAAVSPRHLPPDQYNEGFFNNLRIVALAGLVPITNMLLVFDGKENDINSVVGAFFVSSSVGYVVTFCAEIAITTVLRLALFRWLEPKVFSLTPTVPLAILPWVLRENKYRPRRITLFAADFLTSCVASPIIEEYIKLVILGICVSLPVNFKWTEEKHKANGTKSKVVRVAEAVVRQPGESEVVNANPYITHMLAVSLGVKLTDAARRILLFTKATDQNKAFYAFCRGMFPIQELCGTMTAIGMAKRDLLGVDMPVWKILLPAVVVHGMANFRGMKVRQHMIFDERLNNYSTNTAKTAYLQMECCHAMDGNAVVTFGNGSYFDVTPVDT